MEKEESVTKLIEINTKDSLAVPVANITGVIVKKIKEDRKNAKEVVSALSKILKAEKYKRSYLALSMIEVFSKQGTLQFHEYLSQDSFMKEFEK